MLNLQQNISKAVSLYDLPITLILWVKVQKGIRNFQKAASSAHFFLWQQRYSWVLTLETPPEMQNNVAAAWSPSMPFTSAVSSVRWEQCYIARDN